MYDQREQAAILSDEASSGSLLLAVADSKLPDGWLQWDPEVIRKEVESAFSVDLPPRCFNKLMAAVNVATSEEYWKSLQDFVVLNNALYSGVINLDVVDLATMDEIAVGLTESLLIYPTNPLETFSKPVIDYINGMRVIERFTIPPTIVRIMFGDLCPIWYDDFQALSEDQHLYAAAYAQALDKVAFVDDEVLGRLALSIGQATRAGMVETAAYIDKVLKLIIKHQHATPQI